MVLPTMLVESEPKTRALLARWIEASPMLSLGKTVPSRRQAERLLQRFSPAVLLCAVELIDGSGFDLLAQIAPHTEVVLLASDPGQAARAFDVGAVDYLIKPLCHTRFEQMARRLVRHGLPAPESSESIDTLLVANGTERRVVSLRELMAITALGGNYTELHLASGNSVEARRPIVTWHRTLPRESFVRTHRSAIVNLAYVDRVERRRPNHLALRLRASPIEIPVSRRLARMVRGAMREWASLA